MPKCIEGRSANQNVEVCFFVYHEGCGPSELTNTDLYSSLKVFGLTATAFLDPALAVKFAKSNDLFLIAAESEYTKKNNLNELFDAFGRPKFRLYPVKGVSLRNKA